MIRLDARLRCAFDMLKGARSVADIGCDHGKLSAAMLLDGGSDMVVAGDISPECLKKTRDIIERNGLQDRADIRLGSGLSILTPGECDAAAILGMGGELMIELLEASPEVASSLNRLVLQPMSGIEELRQWLYESSYHVIEDRLVAIGHRWYQLICVCKADGPDPWPQGFPQNCWLVGYRSFADRDRQLGDYCEEQLKKRRIQLRQAMGTTGEDRLARETGQLEQIIKEIHEWN